jgi:glycerol-3-phosphate O-acyltransferase
MASRAGAQTYEPNPILGYVYRRFFEHIQVDETWVNAVRDAASRGSVVYVLRNLSYIDFLALDHLTKRFGLPRIWFANDLGLSILEPMGKGWLRALSPHTRRDEARELTDVIENGGSAALFLKRPAAILRRQAARSGTKRALSEGDELVRALFDVQRRRAEPVLLVPQVFVWTKAPDTRKPSLVDSLLGPREWPGKIRSTLELINNYDNVMLRAGEPVNLSEYLANTDTGSVGSEDDDARIRRLTYAMLRKLERERRAILGPALKATDRIHHEVLRSKRLQGVIRDLAGEGEHERHVVTARATGMLRQLAAQPDAGVVRTAARMLDKVVHRIYDGIEVDQEGLDRVRDAARRGTLVLLPSHKSHLDYMILFYVFYQANLQTPLVAAGDNLSFFPLGAFFRRVGGFFIRRSFSGDKLYASVVDAYIRRLIREGFSIEFYLEGRRSRTGKLLAPKLGLLNMVVEAALSVPNKEVFFVPVSIGYDRVVEGSSYVRELTGGEKEKEDARGLLGTTSVLSGRYGRISIQFGQILSLRDVADPGNVVGKSQETTTAITPAKRRALVTRLAHRVMAEIDAATAVTPGAVVATVLLNHPGHAISRAELLDGCTRLTRLLTLLGARISKSLLASDGGVRADTILDATRLFVDAHMVVATVADHDAETDADADATYVVPDDRRLSLDMSKNIIVHFLVPRALVSTALLARPSSVEDACPASDTVPQATLEQRVRMLSRLFKFEFMFRADRTFEQNFEQTLREMVAASELALTDDGCVTFGKGHNGFDGTGWTRLYASIALTFLLGYRVAARGLAPLLKGPVAQKDLVKRAIANGQRMFSAGEIERREAISRPLIENAFLAFADQGYISISQGKVSLAESFATAAAVKAIDSRISGFTGIGAEP